MNNSIKNIGACFLNEGIYSLRHFEIATGSRKVATTPEYKLFMARAKQLSAITDIEMFISIEGCGCLYTVFEVYHKKLKKVVYQLSLEHSKPKFIDLKKL